MLNEICKHHKEWVRIANSFLRKEDAEDVIQEMYIKLSRLNIELYNKRYGKEINKGYFYTVIRNMCFDFIKKRQILINIDDIQIESIEEVNDNEIFDKVYTEINKWDFYDKTLFEIYMHSGLSFRDIAYGTNKKPKKISKDWEMNDIAVINGSGISVSSMFNTIKKCKLKLKNNIK